MSKLPDLAVREFFEAGGWFSSAVHWIEHEASVVVHYVAPVVKAIVNYVEKHPPVYNGRAK
jgi:hypothetical protein